MKRNEPPKRTATMIIKDIGLFDHTEFKAWCSIHGFTTTGMARVLMRECAKGNIDHTNFDLEDAYSKITRQAKRRKGIESH